MPNVIDSICYDETKTATEKLFDLQIIRAALKQKFEDQKGRGTVAEIQTYRLVNLILDKSAKYRRGYTLSSRYPK